MRHTLLTLCFRHRSSLLLLLAAPIVQACVRGGRLDPSAGAVGLLLVVAGVSLRLHASRQIGRGARVHRAHASAGLVCSGPYTWTRNPLYLAASLMVGGFAALAGAPALALSAATIAVYLPVILHEEEKLSELLGPPYQRYKLRVPRLLGRFYPMAEASDGPRVPWRNVFRIEKALVPGSLAAAAAIPLMRMGILPLALPIQALARSLGVGTDAVVAAGFLLAALGNSWKIERNQRRRHGAPARQTAPA